VDVLPEYESHIRPLLTGLKTAFIFAKRQNMAQEHVSEAQTIEIDALRQLGDMLKATDRAKGTVLNGKDSFGSTKMEPPKNDAPTLSDLGIDKKTSSLAQKLATLPEAEVTSIKSSVRTWKTRTASTHAPWRIFVPDRGEYAGQ
jgi:hypothetical protein